MTTDEGRWLEGRDEQTERDRRDGPTPDEAAGWLDHWARVSASPDARSAAKTLKAERAALRAERAVLRAELEQARAREAAVRPVLDAAERWENSPDGDEDSADALLDALHDYRAAVASPDAGQPADGATQPAHDVSGRTVDAHIWASETCPSVYGRNPGDSHALVRARDLIAEHLASVEAGDIERYDAVSYELATVLERAGALAEAGAPAQPDDETAHGYVLARMTDGFAHYGDRVLELWSDDVYRTLTAASDREVEDVDDEHGGWEVYEVRRVTIPRAALAGAADTEEPTDA